MTMFAVLFLVSATVFGVAVCPRHPDVARVAATSCAVSYCGFFVLLVLGSLRA